MLFRKSYDSDNVQLTQVIFLKKIDISLLIVPHQKREEFTIHPLLPISLCNRMHLMSSAQLAEFMDIGLLMSSSLKIWKEKKNVPVIQRTNATVHIQVTITHFARTIFTFYISF